MERYFTNTKNVELTDRLIEGTMKTIIKLIFTIAIFYFLFGGCFPAVLQRKRMILKDWNNLCMKKHKFIYP